MLERQQIPSERLGESVMKYDNPALCLALGQTVLNTERWRHLAEEPSVFYADALEESPEASRDPAHGLGSKRNQVIS